MSPNEFMEEMKQRGPAPLYLFLGAESYRRRVCKQALIKTVLREEERESGLTTHDLEEVPLQDVIDDARSLSLFAPTRLIWASSAEAAVPKGRASTAAHPGALALADYVQDPSPATVVVLEASRFELVGEGKKKTERVRKFYSAVPRQQVVEFPPCQPHEVQRLGLELARRAGLRMGPSEVGYLAEAVGHDASRVATEIEKLRLFVGGERAVELDDIARLAPSARATTIFELVSALGRGDRAAALDLLDTLVQEGEYLPLALSFLGSQFRQALVVREEGLRTPKQIESYFAQAGTRIWFRKAREIQQTANAFSPAQLKAAVARIRQADEALRDARPDDRTIMEHLVLGLRE